MSLLSKLFCKEEPTAAPVPPEPPVEPDYVPFGPAKCSVTATCAGCGIQKEIPSQYRLGDWRVFNVVFDPSGRKYDSLLACADCKSVFQDALRARDEEYQRACVPHRAEYEEARRYQANWELVNPRPKFPNYPTKEVWVRRTVCGCCGKTDEREVAISQTPGPIDWPRVTPKYGGVKVCPECFDRPDHVALRAELEEREELRNQQVGEYFRSADELRPNWSWPKLPDNWRTTARLKRKFGL